MNTPRKPTTDEAEQLLDFLLRKGYSPSYGRPVTKADLEDAYIAVFEKNKRCSYKSVILLWSIFETGHVFRWERNKLYEICLD